MSSIHEKAKQAGLIPANEARDKANLEKDIEINKQLNQIALKVSKAVEKKCMNMMITDNLLDETKDILRQLGYKVVHTQLGINEYGYKISWNN